MEDADESGRADYWVARIGSIRRFKSKRKDARAPYKPLLLLWLIGRQAAGLPNRVAFADAEEKLQQLMQRHRLGQRVRVGFPFVYLGTSRELWRVQDSKGSDVAKMPQQIKESPVFLRDEAVGALAPDFERVLRDPQVRSAVVNALLNMEFPESLHTEILDEVGLGHLVTPAPQQRDPKFTSTVLLAYENQCSFCGFSGSLRGALVGIDAAHVQMRAHRGPDRIDNGLALCVLHHRLFDRGALGLDENLRIMVSQHIMLREEESPVPVKDLAGEPMRQPQPGYKTPAIPFVKWHRRNLFIGPRRHASHPHHS